MLSLSVILAAIENEDDRKIIAAFYEKNLNYSLSLADSILHNRSFAEDAVQDAFEYIAKNPWRVVQFEEKSAKWFLTELVRDYALNIIRRENGVQKLPVEYLDKELNEVGFLTAIEQARIEDVKAAVEQLGETDRAVIRLFYKHKYKTKEIAKILKLSDSNVRKRLQRARGELKSILENSREEVYE